MLTERVFQATSRANSAAARQPFQVALEREYPAVPVLPETLLLLDLIVQERSVDLRQMSKLVLADLGATLQILRLAGREYGDAEERPTRIEDCILELGLDSCLMAVSAEVLPRDSRRRNILELWEHSGEIAKYSKRIAEDMPRVDPEKAYLAGLLHAIGALPETLGWAHRKDCPEDAPDEFMMAMLWSLPDCVTELFSESDQTGSQMAEIVRRAHWLAEGSHALEPRAHSRPHRVK